MNPRSLTIRSSGPLRRVAVLSCGGQQRPLNSSVRAHMEVTSGILSPDVMAHELSALPSMLQQLGVVEVEAFFGFGCAGPMDELYKSTFLKSPTLHAWVSTKG